MAVRGLVSPNDDDGCVSAGMIVFVCLWVSVNGTDEHVFFAVSRVVLVSSLRLDFVAIWKINVSC